MGYSPLAIALMRRSYERAKKKHMEYEMVMIRQDILHEKMLDELKDFFSNHLPF
jgi:hypothetical protein